MSDALLPMASTPVARALLVGVPELTAWGRASERADALLPSAFAEGAFEGVAARGPVERATLGEARRLLAPGGVLLLDTPVASEDAAKAAADPRGPLPDARALVRLLLEAGLEVQVARVVEAPDGRRALVRARRP